MNNIISLLITMIMFISVFPMVGTGQSNLDSLRLIYEETEGDSLKYEMLRVYEKAVRNQDRAEALPLMKERVRLAEKSKNLDWQAKSYMTLANNFMYLGQNDSALVHMNVAADKSEISGDKMLVSASLGNLAYLYQSLNRIEESISTYHRSISLAIEFHDIEGELSGYVNLSTLLMDQRDYDRAISYLQPLEEKFGDLSKFNAEEKNKIQAFLTASYSNLGQCYVELKKDSLANINFLKAKTYVDFIEEGYSKIFYSSIVDYNLEELKILKCRENQNCNKSFFRESLVEAYLVHDGFKSIEYAEGEGMAKILIGGILTELGAHSASQDTLLASLNLITGLGVIMKSYDALVLNSEKWGRPHDALNFMKESNSVKDQLRNENRDRFYTEQEKKYETLIKDKEIAENLLVIEQKSKAQDQQRFIFIISTLLLLGGGFITYSRYKLKKEKELFKYQKTVNSAMARFVPTAFLKALGREEITEVELGDQVEKEVTVMFSDIRDFTSISEAMTPKQNFDLVAEYAGRMGPIVEAHGGFVNQYMGDGILAIYDSGPTDAVKSCIAMQKEIQRMNVNLKERGIMAIKVGMGLHKGPLIMGIIGDDKRRDATLISDAVNSAARIESATKNYQSDILVSGDVEEEVEGFEFQRVGDLHVKGKTKTIEVFSLDQRTYLDK